MEGLTKCILVSTVIGVIWFTSAFLIALFQYNKLYFFIALVIILTIYFIYKKLRPEKKIKPVKKRINDIHCHYCKKTFPVKKRWYISRLLARLLTFGEGKLIRCLHCGMRVGRM